MASSLLYNWQVEKISGKYKMESYFCVLWQVHFFVGPSCQLHLNFAPGSLLLGWGIEHFFIFHGSSVAHGTKLVNVVENKYTYMRELSCKFVASNLQICGN